MRVIGPFPVACAASQMPEDRDAGASRSSGRNQKKGQQCTLTVLVLASPDRTWPDLVLTLPSATAW